MKEQASKNSLSITPVILSGGSGTRLWPLSRQLNPKQFLNLFGKNSLFQDVALRTKDSCFQKPIVVCNKEHRFTAATQLQQIGIEAKKIILEPVVRNTAPAIAVAAIEVLKTDKENDLLLVMPSDHLIENPRKFTTTIKKAAALAAKGHLITFGVKPTKAETGYGYIKKSMAINDGEEIFAVEKFIEKPRKKVADELYCNPNYFWNSGIFLFRSSTYLEALRQFQSEIFVHAALAHNKAVCDLDFLRLDASEFAKCPNLSVDYAVMEKAKNVAVAPLEISWCDIGSWSSLAEISEKDRNQNHLIGDVVAVETSNCYIDSRHNLLATIGITDLIIIATKDATLIAKKDNAQEVKYLFELLKEQQRQECVSHARVLRPWGSFEIIDLGLRFRVKKITVNPQSALSLQMHRHRAEHWVIVKGEAHVTCDDKEFKLNEDQSTYIPLGKKHRLENRSDLPLELIEVQTGDYLGEDDIIRFDDNYGR